MKVVVVEDEIRIREGICALIEKMFPEIEIAGSAENGRAGLECIRKSNPDIVIMDIKMPVMDGLEMLSEAQKCGHDPKVVVLTAYSEFSYAQKAVKLGVSDYLVKPIVVQEFAQTMRKVQNLCKQEQKRTPEMMGNLSNVLLGFLHGTTVLDDSMEKYLEQKFHIQRESPMLEVIIYIGNTYAEEKENQKRRVSKLLEQKTDIEYSLVELEYDSSLLLFLYHYPSRQEIERWYQHEIFRLQNLYQEWQISYGITEIIGIENIKEGYQQLLQYMDWNIVLGNDVLISYPKIRKIQTEVCIYPMELENQTKAALCIGDEKKVLEMIDKFHHYFSDGKVYTPKEIKESYVRFLWNILNIAKEIGSVRYGDINYQSLIDRIMGAKTSSELKNACDIVMDRVGMDQGKMEAISLPVRRARSMIHEFYADGITLAEIADRLNITQEYLGNQFHKELGENFSSYIRNYRIGKAKELLIATQMKQYEIAEKVGYTDAKYFARVFLKTVGMSPAEYRQQNR